VTQAGDLRRHLRPRHVPDDVRAAVIADLGPAANLRVERRGAGAGACRDRGWRLVLAVGGAAADDLGDVRQRRAESADRCTLCWAEGAGVGRPVDLSRAIAARLGTPQVALQDTADR